MELQIELAGTTITIDLLDQAEKAVTLCNTWFRGFLLQGKRSHARVKVRIVGKGGKRFPVRSRFWNPVFERLLSNKEVAEWVRRVPGYENDLRISEKTICSFCLNGLLLFDPGTSAGCIYLLTQGPKRFTPLYRLLWTYFAQVLGEKEQCFVHAAALVRDQMGYLFLGDSGAGKSTLSRSCRDCHVFSDDSPIMGEQDGKYLVFPSPFQQMDPFGSLNEEVAGKSAEVKGFYFIKKDKHLYLEELSRKKAVSMIVHRHIHFFSYLSVQARVAIFDLFRKSCHNIPAYDFYFTQNGDGLQFIASI